jgi:hypothetical protein
MKKIEGTQVLKRIIIKSAETGNIIVPIGCYIDL